MKILEVKDLHAEVIDPREKEDVKEILKGLNLNVEKGTVHAIMGPNGSGKSTLANAIMGNKKYNITKGDILFEGKSILELSVSERAKLGIFLSFQYPQEIEGVTISNFLRTTLGELNKEGKKPSVMDFKELLEQKSKLLDLPDNFSDRYLNKGFSGGEKKKSEMLQLSILNPKLAILDETDSGLDIDALKIIAHGIKSIKEKNPDMTILIITHYKRILEYLTPDKLSIVIKGKIVMEGDANLVDDLEKKGYSWIEEE